MTFEVRANYNKKIQLEGGLTYQKSDYDDPVEYISGLSPVTAFLRSPDIYGYTTLSLTPGKRFSASFTGVFTGPMQIAHFAGAPEQAVDEYVTTPSFAELGIKASYSIPFEAMNTALEFSVGVKNILNAYQDDFDSGKYRDSNYVYGPGAPRTIAIGLKIKSL
jgi:outer membrane receptor for ferrienterochelin and colicins